MSFRGRFRSTRAKPADGCASRRTGAVCWQPLEWGTVNPLHGAAAQMGDPGQVTATAYEVTFLRPGGRGSRIIVCTYAAETHGAYRKGIRYTYSVSGDQGGFYTGYEKDPSGQTHAGAAEADLAAYDLALLMACDLGWPAATMPTIFGWDGQPSRNGDG